MAAEDNTQPIMVRYAFPQALLFAAFIVALIFVLSTQSRVFDSFEYWTTDWRTALFSKRLKSQHPQIAIVLINDTTLTKFKYRSPIDRAFLAELTTILDQAEPKAVGFDLLFDQPTEPEKDAALLKAFKEAKTKLVLLKHDDGTRLELTQQTYHTQFLSETGRITASPALQIEADGTVRRFAQTSSQTLLFSQALAKEAGSNAQVSRYIAWLQSPHNEEAFQTIYAHDLVPQYSVLSLQRRIDVLASLKGKVVIVGANLEDRRDSFQTPLSKLTNDQMPGAVVHAHMTAQILDNRSYITFPQSLIYILAALAAFFAFSLGWRYPDSGFVTGVAPLVVFVLLDVVCFTQFNLFLPFAMPAAAWVAGVVCGQWFHHVSNRRRQLALRKSRS